MRVELVDLFGAEISAKDAAHSLHAAEQRTVAEHDQRLTLGVGGNPLLVPRSVRPRTAGDQRFTVAGVQAGKGIPAIHRDTAVAASERPAGHRDVVALAGQQVEVIEFQGRTFVESLLGDRVETLHPMRFAGSRVHRKDENTAVGKRLTAGGKVGHSVADEHAARNRPGRFELAVSDDAFIERRGALFPDHFSVGSAQAINPTILGAEQAQALVQRRGGIHAPASGETPANGSRRRVQSHDFVGIGTGDDDRPTRDDRARNGSLHKRILLPIGDEGTIRRRLAQVHGPQAVELHRPRGRRAATPPGIVAVTGPVVGREHLTAGGRRFHAALQGKMDRFQGQVRNVPLRPLGASAA